MGDDENHKYQLNSGVRMAPDKYMYMRRDFENMCLLKHRSVNKTLRTSKTGSNLQKLYNYIIKCQTVTKLTTMVRVKTFHSGRVKTVSKTFRTSKSP